MVSMKKLNRKIIEAAALELGAKQYAVDKWRQRKIPFRWQVEIAEHFKTKPANIREGYVA